MIAHTLDLEREVKQIRHIVFRRQTIEVQLEVLGHARNFFFGVFTRLKVGVMREQMHQPHERVLELFLTGSCNASSHNGQSHVFAHVSKFCSLLSRTLRDSSRASLNIVLDGSQDFFLWIMRNKEQDHVVLWQPDPSTSKVRQQLVDESVTHFKAFVLTESRLRKTRASDRLNADASSGRVELT